MRRAARFGAAALTLGFAALAGAAGAMQAPAPADGPPDPALACGVEIFGEADDRLFGESYAFARARTTDRDPPERMRVIGRLDSQLEVCRRRDRLGADEAQIVEVYAATRSCCAAPPAISATRAPIPRSSIGSPNVFRPPMWRTIPMRHSSGATPLRSSARGFPRGFTGPRPIIWSSPGAISCSGRCGRANGPEPLPPQTDSCDSN